MSNSEEETYNVKVYCTNCEWTGKMDIPKGVSINKHSCPNCGCAELEKSYEDD